MSIPLIKKLSLANYRVFSSFDIEGLRRVNLIGGLNGTGKTTLLEALFLFMDRGGLMPFVRTTFFRGLPQGLSLVDGVLFRDRSQPVKIQVTLRSRDVCKMHLIWEAQSFPAKTEVPGGASQDTTSEASVLGLTLKVEEAGNLILDRRYIENGEGYALNDRVNNPTPSSSAQAVFLSRSTMGLPDELSGRYSQIVKLRKKRNIISIIQSINPDVEDLELLNVKGASILHAHLNSGAIIPISMVGDGAQTILAICMAIITSPSGVVMLDEFEAAIHYSKMSVVWRLIFELSREFNVQVFAATHSLEAINAAVECATGSGWGEDIAYYRLDKVHDLIKATRYDKDQLKFADDEAWELR